MEVSENVREETLPDGVEQGPEAFRLDGVGQVEAVAVELGDTAGGDDDAGGVASKLNHVEGLEEGAAEGRGEAVVRGRRPCQHVDLRLGRGADNLAARVGAHLGDGDAEEGSHDCARRSGCCEAGEKRGG